MAQADADPAGQFVVRRGRVDVDLQPSGDHPTPHLERCGARVGQQLLFLGRVDAQEQPPTAGADRQMPADEEREPSEHRLLDQPRLAFQHVAHPVGEGPVIRHEGSIGHNDAMEEIAGPRVATLAEAGTVAALLDEFNREFATPTPGPAVLTRRLDQLLAGGTVLALLSGSPAAAVALVTLRPNVWYDGPVALLDELYVAPDRRGQGVGSRLLAAAEAAVRQRGAVVVEINVDGEDTDARRFYERHGYANTEPGQDESMLYYYRELG